MPPKLWIEAQRLEGWRLITQHVVPQHCNAGLGRLYRRTGDPKQAQEHLTTASAMYGEMGMTPWLEQLAND